MTQGTKEQIMVVSVPSGATTTLSNGETRVTPFTLTVPRDEDLQFHFAKPGYQSTDVADDSHIEGGYLVADFLIPIMWGIDAATGAYFTHQQPMVVAHLDPEKVAASDSSGNAGASSSQGKSPASSATKADHR
jgi:hypothetical protein